MLIKNENPNISYAAPAVKELRRRSCVWNVWNNGYITEIHRAYKSGDNLQACLVFLCIFFSSYMYGTHVGKK